MGLAEIDGDGDRLASLRALRREIAQTIDRTASARELGVLSARYMDVLEQIEQVESRQAPRSSARDEIAARRAAKATRAGGSRRKAV